MRELKLRAWDKENKRFLFRSIFDRNWYATPKNDDKGCHTVRGIEPSDRNTLDVVLFTTLFDKSRNELYGNDIIEVNNDYEGEVNRIRCLIKWGKGQWIAEDSSGGSWTRQLYHQSERIERIGNIYENKDLFT